MYDETGNMPCDYSGFCVQAGCPIFYECAGKQTNNVKVQDSEKENEHGKDKN